MFWRQIPRATDVLGRQQTDLESPAFPSLPTTSPRQSSESHRPTYSSRDASNRFDSKKEWKKVIREVEKQNEGDSGGGGGERFRETVEAAVEMEKDRKRGLKGFAVRLRRKSSAKFREIDKEELALDDPITLAKITPFEGSPPASLCGGSREDRLKPIESPDSLKNFDSMKRQLPSQRSSTPPRRPTSADSHRSPPSPMFSDDDSTLPPYEPPNRSLPSRPMPLNRSATSFAPSSQLPIVSHPRPALERRATFAAPPAQVSLPPLPPPPTFDGQAYRRPSSAASHRSLPYNHEFEQSPPREGRSTSRRLDEEEDRYEDSERTRHLSRRRSTASLRQRQDRVAYHQMYRMSGLTNLGNSCYLSAVLQSLAATAPLADFLASGEYRQEVNRSNRNGSQGQVASALSVLFQAMSSGKHRVITAGRFRDIISSASRFDNADQQDAHDFLLHLLAALHEDLNLVLEPSRIRENSPQREDELASMPEVVAADSEWAKYRDQNDSIVIDFFQGQLRNQMECLYCHQTSTTYNPLQTLPLPIPEQQGEIPLQLEDCIDEFLREEILEDEEAWKCPRCRKLRAASKQLVVTRLPQIVIVQLKRFTSYDSFSSKVETPIDFPIDSLELGYLLPRKSTSSRYKLNLPHETSTKYQLYALVNHIGGEHTSGHYTSIVRKGSDFVEIDDETITPLPASDIVDRFASSVYLLFYRLCKE